MPSSDDVREHQRFEVDACLDLAASIQNISLGGICIQAKTFEEVGALVDVILHFPELGRDLAVRGQVVWANREPPPDVGIRWVDLDEPKRSLLSEYIDRVRTRQG